MKKSHDYQTTLVWTGNRGEGTANYRAYDRDHILKVKHKPDILVSSDPAFRGDPSRYNPEELFLGSISSCHMLWYLHLCSENGVIVVHYEDAAKGVMEEAANGSGRFTSVTLFPVVTVAEASMIELANRLHYEANKMCFIANSLNVKVRHEPKAVVEK